ncbi:hypothetical protein QOZ67_31015, partial [Pseudomonas aeruginosa]|uniref:hypothetical protein n=1 Tax=Pseudomonas aeruginosa TaxID=287 RepID=UPI003459CBA2
SLKAHNLKLVPKKCNFLQRSVKFLGHMTSADGVATDPEKVRAITGVTEADLMEDGTDITSLKKLRSFLGMVGVFDGASIKQLKISTES